ncbi:MAG: hypothetical protein ACXWNZ_01015 [Vulcanimicrobiaceae bacterium]
MRPLTIVSVLAMFSAGLPVTAQTAPQPSASPFKTVTIAQESPEPSGTPSQWQYGFTPYIWAPSVNGSLTFSRPFFPATGVPPSAVDFGVHVGPNKYLTHLNFAAMFTADARSGPWDVFTDVIDLSLSSSKASVDNVKGPGGRIEFPLNVNNTVRLSSLLWTLGVSYSVMQRGKTSIDLLAGSRLANFRTSIDWNFAGPLDVLPRTGSASRNVTIWDPIFGFRGRVGVGSNWFVPYYGDFGWGDKNTTYQAFIGIGYTLKHGQNIILVNRWLEYSMDQGPINYLQLVGPTLGYRIRF